MMTCSSSAFLCVFLVITHTGLGQTRALKGTAETRQVVGVSRGNHPRVPQGPAGEGYRVSVRPGCRRLEAP